MLRPATAGVDVDVAQDEDALASLTTRGLDDQVGRPPSLEHLLEVGGRPQRLAVRAYAEHRVVQAERLGDGDSEALHEAVEDPLVLGQRMCRRLVQGRPHAVPVEPVPEEVRRLCQRTTVPEAVRDEVV